jgi:mRNA deadenylase 3'-5' endonuclease subunit Ccr4
MLSSQYTILQWNILAKLFCDKKAFPKVDEKYLDWDYRKELHKDIIKEKNPDIMTLQEVDVFEELRNDILMPGYASIYFQKNEGGQGIAVCYKEDKFKLIDSQKVELPADELGTASNQFFCHFLFEEYLTKKHFFLITTHLKSHESNENIRLSQIRFMINYFNKELHELKEKWSCSNCPIILTGDFNAEPTYSTIKELEKFEFHNGDKFYSVYDYKNNEIEMTTFKIRNKELYRIIDYIFYTGPISVISKELPPRKENFTEIHEIGLPSKDFPSDHWFLLFKFSIN